MMVPEFAAPKTPLFALSSEHDNVIKTIVQSYPTLEQEVRDMSKQFCCLALVMAAAPSQ